MKYLTLFAFALIGSVALAQAPPPKARLLMPSEAVRPGHLFTVVVEIAFADGLHGYQNPPSEDYMIPITVSAGPKTEVTAIRYPKGHAAKIGGSPTEVMTYSGTIRIPVTVRAVRAPGKADLELNVMYQQCTDDSCFPPGNLALKASVQVAGSPLPNLATRLGADIATRARVQR